MAVARRLPATAWFALALLAAVLAPWAAGRSGLALSLLTQVAWTSIVCLSFNLLLGQCGLLSFGHALPVGAGALAAVHAMRWGAAGGWLPLPLVPLAGGLAALLLAVPVGFVSTRRSGTGFAMITLALGELAAALALMLPGVFGGEGGVSADRVYGTAFFGLDFGPPLQVYGLAAAYAVVCAGLLFGLSRTALGRMFNAVRDNPLRVTFLGSDPRRLRWLACLASAFFAGVGGALGAVQFEIVTTADAVGLARSGGYLLFTFLGGITLFAGPVIGAVLLVLSTVLLAQWSPAWPLYLGIAFLLAVLFAPSGVAGLLAAAPGAWRRSGWKLCGLRCAGAALAAGGLMALVEMGYRLQADALAPALQWGLTLDPHRALPWLAAAAMACAGVAALAWRRPAGQGGA